MALVDHQGKLKMNNKQAHSLYSYWVIAINSGKGLKTYPDNFRNILHATARHLRDEGFPELADRLLNEWDRKQGLVYGRYYAELDTYVNVDNDVNDKHVNIPPEKLAKFKEAYDKWIEFNSDPLKMSQEAYQRRIKERRGTLVEKAAT